LTPITLNMKIKKKDINITLNKLGIPFNND
jgi:hypothetical protein